MYGLYIITCIYIYIYILYTCIRCIHITIIQVYIVYTGIDHIYMYISYIHGRIDDLKQTKVLITLIQILTTLILPIDNERT